MDCMLACDPAYRALHKPRDDDALDGKFFMWLPTFKIPYTRFYFELLAACFIIVHMASVGYDGKSTYFPLAPCMCCISITSLPVWLFYIMHFIFDRINA